LPPAAVKTIEDLLYWQYSKLIARSAGYDKNYRFIMDRFKKLSSGEINWSGSIREYIREQEVPGQCIYCGSKEKESLSVDHLIPKSRGGIDGGDNLVVACKKCNSRRKDKGIYEWYQLERRNEVPRIVEGKYLKELYSLHEEKDTLNIDKKQLKKLCENCRPGYLCKNTALTVYCLESIF